MALGWYAVYGCSRVTEIYPSRVKEFTHGDIYKIKLNGSDDCDWQKFCFIDPVYMTAVGLKSRQETSCFENVTEGHI